MATDIFGYNKDIRSSGIMTSEYVSVDIGGTGVGLGQSVDANYSQTIQPRYVLGSSVVYFLGGQSQGTVTVGRYVGESGLGNFPEGGCGRRTSVAIGGTGDACFSGGSGKLTFSDAIFQSVGFAAQAGSLDVVENLTFFATTLS